MNFVWDETNLRKIDDNGLSADEVEEVFLTSRDFDISRSSGRPVCFGYTSAGEYVMVVYDEIDAHEFTVRVCSAFVVPEPRVNE